MMKQVGKGILDERSDVPARLRASFLEALAADYAEHGPAAIAALRTEKPADYVKMVAALLPKAPEGKEDGPVSIAIRFVAAG